MDLLLLLSFCLLRHDVTTRHLLGQLHRQRLLRIRYHRTRTSVPRLWRVFHTSTATATNTIIITNHGPEILLDPLQKIPTKSNGVLPCASITYNNLASASNNNRADCKHGGLAHAT